MAPENESKNGPQEDPFEFDRWAGRTKGVEGRLAKDFRISVDEADGLVVEETIDLPLSYGEKRAIRYVYVRPDAATEDRIVVTTYEFISLIDAHRGLIRAVTTYMAPTLPRCESRGIELGDVCFACHGDAPVALIFARYNVLIEIQSVGRHELSVVDLAKQIDELILQERD
jgi:hypothetical protein